MGISHATHVFNAMSGLAHSASLRANGERSRTMDKRDPGVVGAVLLDDRVTAEIILDLIHVHKVLVGLLLQLKKKDRVIVVTDSIKAEIASPRQKAAGLAMTGGAYRFKDGKLAGSSLTMINALKNAVTRCNMPLSDAVRLMTLNPARLLGVAHSKGSIEAGKDADIVIFNSKFSVKMTIIGGRMLYVKDKI